MGEYANFNGERIKIGTCEDLYYLRADQRRLVSGGDLGSSPERYFVDGIRFRFPFPDEDELEPGRFEDYDRGERIPGGWTIPDDYEHDGGVQFHAEPGYLLYLPCPESPNFPEAIAPKLGRNGWHGGYAVKQQRMIDGELWTVVACLSCGSKWRLPRDEAEAVAVAFRDEVDRLEQQRTDVVWPEGDEYPKIGSYTDSPTYEMLPVHTEKRRGELHAIADRILAGYALEAVA